MLKLEDSVVCIKKCSQYPNLVDIERHIQF